MGKITMQGSSNLPENWPIDRKQYPDRLIGSSCLCVAVLCDRTMDVSALGDVAGVVRDRQMELLVRCENVTDLDLATKTPLMCVLFGRQFGQWCELGRTEAVDELLNPRFTETFFLKHDVCPNNSLKFAVYHIDPKSVDLAEYDLVGAVETSLSSLVQPETKITQTMYTLRAPGNAKGRGQITIVAEMVRPTRSRMLLHLGATLLNKTGILHMSKRSTCLEICRSLSENAFHPIYRTRIIQRDQNPRWRPCELSVQKLCNGDLDRKLQIVCWQIKEKLEKKPLLKLKNNSKKNTPSTKGYIHFLQARLDLAFTARSYIQGGCSLRFMVAIDFTSSNGDPSLSSSLHHLGTTDNEYVGAIRTLGGMLSHYDLEQEFATFGFGAKMSPDTKTKHCFPLNGRRSNPYCNGISGVLDAYSSAVGRLTLGGPSLLAPVLRKATRLAKRHSACPSLQQYSVLMVVTDGVVNDLDDTMDALIASCAAPLSVVIVGIGPADFSTMEELLRHNPDQPLTSTRSKQSATRSNVHFAAIKRDRYIDMAANNKAVGREALASVSRQMVAYLGELDIRPNKPRMHRSDPTLGSWVMDDDVTDSTRHVMTGTLRHGLRTATSCATIGPTCPTCGSLMEAETESILHFTTPTR